MSEQVIELLRQMLETLKRIECRIDRIEDGTSTIDVRVIGEVDVRAVLDR